MSECTHHWTVTSPCPYCQQKLIVSLWAALAATDHLYHDDGEVRSFYEYDDDREALDEMARARNKCRAGA